MKVSGSSESTSFVNNSVQKYSSVYESNDHVKVPLLTGIHIKKKERKRKKESPQGFVSLIKKNL